MSLWYTDRSRYEAGLDYCKFKRYLSFHAGPNGYGMSRTKQSMPLIVGIPVHEANAAILSHVIATDTLPTEEVVRCALEPQIRAYRAKVERFGVAQVEQTDAQALEFLIQEQTALLKGMVWSWVIEVLPYLHQRYRFLSVEVEEELVLDCTCGLGDRTGTFAEHEARECQGIGFMSRADAIGDLRESPGTLSWHDFKTTSYASERWESQWETKLQFALGTLAAERRLGQEFHEHYIHGLFKGARRRKKDPATGEASGPKYQDSPFCYGWLRPGNPPLEPDDWKPTYEWFDEWGKRHVVSARGKRPYIRTPVWTYPAPEPYDPVEYWVRMLPDYARQKQLQLVGPLNRQRVMIDSLGRQVVGEERRWQRDLYELYQCSTTLGADYWTNPTYQQLLDKLVPKSWACRRYGKEHRCEFERVCFREAGWEDPLANGYQLRRPHHLRELEQMQERGLEPPEVWGEDEHA